jgi:hypothetical protein
VSITNAADFLPANFWLKTGLFLCGAREVRKNWPGRLSWQLGLALAGAI